MSAEPRFLVVDGYRRAGREELTAGGASTGGELYAQLLRRCAPGPCVVDVIYPADPGVALPQGAALQSYDGIAWSGSSLSLVDADDPGVMTQVEFARAAFAAHVPSFGSCWAAQLAVVAAGGRVAPHPQGREMGLARKILLSDAGRGHPMYAGKASVFDAFTSHEDEITHLPPGAVVLASNAYTAVQAVCVTHQGGVCWGVQYHPEYDLHELARLTFCRIAKLTKMGFFRDREAALAYVAQLEALHADPTRKDLAWLLGIDADVMQADVRWAEARNWIERLVIPSMRR